MAIAITHVISASLFEAVVAFYSLPSEYLTKTLTTVFFYVLLVNFTIFSTYTLVVYPLFLSPLRHLPKARGSKPIVGHTLGLFERPPGATHLRIMKETPNDGLVRVLGFFHSEQLILTNPAALADVLVHKSYEFEKPPFARTFLKKFLGNGLLMTEGDEHKHHRKQIMPAFHFRHIKELYPVFWSKSVEMCDVVRVALIGDSSNVLEMGHYATQVTLDIIGLAGLGRDICSLRNTDDELIKNYEELLEPSTEKAVYFLVHLIIPAWLVAMLPWKLNETVKTITSNLNRICTALVVDKKSGMKHESKDGADVLSTMIRSDNFSDSNLVDQLLTFLAAGHETTSSALTWATYLLSKHPEAQARLRAEIHESIPDPTVLSTPGFDIAGLLEGMPYLNGVCNEVLRLFPTIPVTARVATRNTTINNVFIPAGTQVFVVPWAINRNPSLWGPDAEDFVPERWIDKETGRASMNGGADSNYAFLTFLHGPRSCIGERFARAELRALLAAFVGHFDMQMANPNELVIAGGTVTSKPVSGMNLRLAPVDWKV